MIDKALNERVQSIRQKNLKKAKGCTKAGRWKERDVLDGEAVDVGVVVLPTKGCRWGRASGCTMCGYVYAAGSLSDEELSTAFKDALSDLGDASYLKLFTSGSFFDPGEVSEELVSLIIEAVNEKCVRQFQVESRPEFIKKEALESVKENLSTKLEVGIGLESSS